MFRLYIVTLVLFLFLPSQAEELTKDSVLKVLPAYQQYVEKSRSEWEVPQVAVAVVYDDEILWWSGFGDVKPDQETVFAIGSTTKAFTATTLAMMVDGGGPGWTDKVADHVAGFGLYDPWVTRELQVDDLLAQHLGFAPQALSGLAGLGYSRDQIIAAMRWVKPVSSFRSTYAYVNSPHLVAGKMVAKWAGANSWEEVLSAKILQPLNMKTTTWTESGLNDNPNSARGHARVDGKVKPISTGPFPYVFGPAGALNSNLHDMTRWVRFQLGNGEFEGRRLVSEENLLVTRTPQTPMSSSGSYCMGWLKMDLNGETVVWHNGGTPGHTTFVGMQPQHGVGVIVLSNLGGTVMPDSVGLKFFDMIHGHDGPDYSAQTLARRKDPELKPVVAAPIIPGMAASYQHPALGTVTLSEDLDIVFEKTGFSAKLEPIGPNLFRIRDQKGWLKEIGWDNLGEALYAPPGLSESASLTLYIGEENEGASYRLTPK